MNESSPRLTITRLDYQEPIPSFSQPSRQSGRLALAFPLLVLDFCLSPEAKSTLQDDQVIVERRASPKRRDVHLAEWC